MARLIHLNGPTGSGKSTVARAYLSRAPGTLLVDPDTLLASIGGWQDDFWGLLPVARHLAAALAEAHLRTQSDVVVAQLCTSLDEVRPFEDAATRAGAEYQEVHLICPADTVLERYQAVTTDSGDAVRAAVYGLISRAGGESLIEKIGEDFARYQALRPRAMSLRVAGLTVDAIATSISAVIDDRSQLS